MSDHDNQLIVVVDDMDRGRAASEAWMRNLADRHAGNATERTAPA